MRAPVRLLICVITAFAAISLLGCQPSQETREHELREFLRSLAEGTSTWEKYAPAENRAAVLKAQPSVTTDFEILGWDHASVCCGFGDDLYEYTLRFSNGREAVSYVSVENGRVSKITIDFYDHKTKPKTGG